MDPAGRERTLATGELDRAAVEADTGVVVVAACCDWTAENDVRVAGATARHGAPADPGVVPVGPLDGVSDGDPFVPRTGTLAGVDGMALGERDAAASAMISLKSTFSAWTVLDFHTAALPRLDPAQPRLSGVMGRELDDTAP
jgi:hypothetical protein